MYLVRYSLHYITDICTNTNTLKDKRFSNVASKKSTINVIKGETAMQEN